MLNYESKLSFSLQKTSAECGRGWIRTTEAITQQIYSLPHLATLEHALRQKLLALGLTTSLRSVVIKALALLPLKNKIYATLQFYFYSFLRLVARAQTDNIATLCRH